MIGDFGAGDAGGDQAVAVLLHLLGRHVEGDMVHGADRARQVTLIGARRRRADAGHAVGRVGEPEEGEAVASAAVEEEVLPHAGRQLNRLDQRHAQHVRVEVDGPLHVAAHEREMVDAPELESAGPVCHEPALPRRRRSRVPGGPPAQDTPPPQSCRWRRPYDPRPRAPTKGRLDMAAEGQTGNGGSRQSPGGRKQHRQRESRHAGPDESGVGPLPGLSPPSGWPPPRSRSPWSWRCPAGPPAPPARHTPRRSRSRPPRWPGVGTVLTTASGLTLYRFTEDKPGTSTCTGACAKIWPPLLASKGAHVSGPNGVKGLSLLKVGNGHWQVAFHKLPLYRFEGDKKKGQAHGQNVGKVWFAVLKSGIPASNAAPTAPTTPTTRRADHGDHGGARHAVDDATATPTTQVLGVVQPRRHPPSRRRRVRRRRLRPRRGPPSQSRRPPRRRRAAPITGGTGF